MLPSILYGDSFPFRKTASMELSSLVWKNFTGLHRTLISALTHFNTFGMNFNE